MTLAAGRAAAAAERLASGAEFTTMFRHGSLAVEFYVPDGEDKQTPHPRDEVYVVASGTGTFDHDGEVQVVEAGEVLFVPAGAPHRFVTFTDDFATWVFFYGPVGGEAETPEILPQP